MEGHKRWAAGSQGSSTRLWAPDDVQVSDREFPIADFQAAGVPAWVTRRPKNFTARRASPPPYTGRCRPPTRGLLVRPLARCRKERVIPAIPPDQVTTWAEAGQIVRAEIWTGLVLPELALVAGSVLRHAAATLLATPTGVWDRQPRPTPRRLQRVLARGPFPQELALLPRLRPKAIVTDHLPTGWCCQRRPAAGSVPDPASPKAREPAVQVA